MSIRGGSATEREGRARAHAQQFWAALQALEGPDDAFMVQHWSPLDMDLYFSPAAIAMGHGLFECAGAVPCAAPDPAETWFYAGSEGAARAWTTGTADGCLSIRRPAELHLGA
ncbi:hypothetical protein [Zavarzinia sp. CC-PAN008]|uniref:hypothetical protein n=1 Tax=Zavarzinia sp. CC-PAN008 TaxID=3243332 RepID=UPI003F743CCB